MIKTAKYLTVFLQILHGIAAIGALVVLITLVFTGSVKGELLESIFQTGAVYDKENDTAIVREISVYGLDITGVYKPHYSHDFKSDYDYITGESTFYHHLNYIGCEYNTGAAYVYIIGCFIILVLMTVVFDFIHNILESADSGKIRFNKDAASLLKYAGILLVMVSFVCLVTSFIGSLLTSAEKISINDVTFTIGLFLICLSKFFNYGSKLEKDAQELI